MKRTKHCDIKDISLATTGKKKIEWAGRHMPVLRLIQKRFEKEKTLKGLTLGACLHVTSETANLMLALKAGGAKVSLCASNPLSTQDDVAASLVKDFGIGVYAVHGENNQTYYRHINQVLDTHPQITMDDGADLISILHSKRPSQIKEVFGSSEETTTGVIRLKAMAADGALKLPVIAVNNSDTKHLFDNRYGTGQSTIDGIMRATNILLAGKNITVAGYGWCGRGIAMRAKGMGAHVIICETDPVRALEAVMDGYTVLPMIKAAAVSDILITATGDKNVITLAHIKTMKDGVILANSGHFNVEIDMIALVKSARSKRVVRPNVTEYTLGWKRVNVLAEGRLVNLAAAEGHPAEVMDLSFANQALAAEYIASHRGKLENKVHVLPQAIDQTVARLKLKAMNIGHDRLSQEQKKYLSSWKEGT